MLNTDLSYQSFIYSTSMYDVLITVFSQVSRSLHVTSYSKGWIPYQTAISYTVWAVAKTHTFLQTFVPSEKILLNKVPRLHKCPSSRVPKMPEWTWNTRVSSQCPQSAQVFKCSLGALSVLVPCNYLYMWFVCTHIKSVMIGAIH